MSLREVESYRVSETGFEVCLWRIRGMVMLGRLLGLTRNKSVLKQICYLGVSSFQLRGAVLEYG